MNKAFRLLLMLGLSLAIGTPFTSHAQDSQGSKRDSGRGVFVMNNDAYHNAVLTYRRESDGSLTKGANFLTGGRGSGGTTDPLGSQGSLTLSSDGSLLFAVNAGSGELSMFRVSGSSLRLLDVAACGGSEPVAVAQHGDLVYLVNAGGTSNVVGFRIYGNQKLKRIPNASALLSTGNSGPGSIQFSPDGNFLLVTEKATNRIDSFRVLGDGTLGPLVSTPSAGPGAFAVTFAANGAALVAETGPAGGTNASAISSYAVAGNGTFVPITTSVPTLGAATCWLEITPDQRFVYTANSASSALSGFALAHDGSLTPLPGTVLATLAAGSTDIDFAISSDGRFLYTLNTGSGTIGIFGIAEDGSLNSLGEVGGLLAKSGFNGLAAN